MQILQQETQIYSFLLKPFRWTPFSLYCLLHLFISLYVQLYMCVHV